MLASTVEELLRRSRLEIDKRAFEQMLKAKFWVQPSFSIYGGVAGLYDMGPPGAAMKQNLLAFWRKHFVYEENMLELDSVCLTPDRVLEVSGHKDKFFDYQVQDKQTGLFYRADKYLTEVLTNRMKDSASAEEQEELRSFMNTIDGLSQGQLAQAFRDYKITSPEGNELTDPFPFNLMFTTSIGPSGNAPAFLRPETAQGIFTSFKKLLEFNGGRMPFAAATIGQAFRNEIAPRHGLLRVREFTLAEIEHFLDPEDMSHPKLDSVANLVLPLLSVEMQRATGIPELISIRHALDTGMIRNPTLAYYLGRVSLFLDAIGVKPGFFRFKQHDSKALAHYADDCWDAELLTTVGWEECIGVADRTDFDCGCHNDAQTDSDLTARREYAEPITIRGLEAQVAKAAIGKAFRKQAQTVIQALEGLDQEDASALSGKLQADGVASLTVDGETFEITSAMVSFEMVEKKEHGKNYVPYVVEPSFGVGRILYSVLEQAFNCREGDEQRIVLSLSPMIAPYQCVLVPLVNTQELMDMTSQVADNLSSAGVSIRQDTSSTAIGRKYARADSLGIPFAVTVDFDSLTENTVTLRERDSCRQVRLPVSEVESCVHRLCQLRLTWPQVLELYPEQEQSASEKIGK